MATEDEMLRDSMMAGSGIVPAEEPEPKPKPSYRIRSVDPKMGDIDEQFAMIETDKAYGAPASDPTMRRIVVGDELPEGSVTAITPEGIRVIPDYEGSEEYVIPLGREGYEPPEPKKEHEYFFGPGGAADSMPSWAARSLESAISKAWQPDVTPDERAELRQQFIDQAREDQMNFFEGDDAIDPDEVSEMVGAQFDHSFEDDKTLEMTQTPEGMQFLFQDEDGNLSEYIKIDETGEVIRTTPSPGAVDTYGTTQSPRVGMTPLEEIIEMVKIRAAADSL
jgi:hypothetical protein